MNKKDFACGKRGKHTVIWLSPQYDQLILEKFGYTPGDYRSKEGYRFRVPENTEEIRSWLTELKIAERRRVATTPQSASDSEPEPAENMADQAVQTESGAESGGGNDAESEENFDGETENHAESEEDFDEEDDAESGDESEIETDAESGDEQDITAAVMAAIESDTGDDETVDDEEVSVAEESSHAFTDFSSENASESQSEYGADCTEYSEQESEAFSAEYEAYSAAVKGVEKSVYKAIRFLLSENPDAKSVRVAQYLQYVVDQKISALI